MKTNTPSIPAPVIETKLAAFSEVVQQLFVKAGIENSLIDETLFPESPFSCLYLKEFNLAIHCINTNYKSDVKLSPTFFANMSDVAEGKKIKLIHLWYDVWASQNDLVQRRLLAQVGISDKVFARNTQVVSLSKRDADVFFNQYHLQQTASAKFYYGLKYKHEIVAAIAFSKARKMTYENPGYNSYELIRFASKSGVTVTGGLSKLMQHFIKAENVKHIMTYADRDWSDGVSYRKLGFKFVGILPPQSFYIDRIGLKRYFIPENGPVKINGYSKKTGVWKIENTLIKIFNAGSAKYILDLR